MLYNYRLCQECGCKCKSSFRYCPNCGSLVNDAEVSNSTILPGDEVIAEIGKMIVTSINADCGEVSVKGIMADGESMGVCSISAAERTGRSFPEVIKAIKAMNDTSGTEAE